MPAHMSMANAAAQVHLAEAIASIARATERKGASRLEALYDARNAIMDTLTSVDAAIATEIAANPKASPTVRRIQQAALAQA